MFIPNTFSGQTHRFSFIGGEARLCHELNPTESINAGRLMQENQALREARAIYNNEFLIREYPELARPQDRAFFQALLIAGMATDATIPGAIGNRNRSGFRPFDPAQLLPAGTALPSTAELTRIGARLREVLPQAQRDNLVPAAENPTDEQLATAYFNSRNRWTTEWNAGRNVHDRARQLEDRSFDALVRMPIELYRSSRATLDSILRTNNIDIPGSQSPDAPGRRMSTRDYVGLLTLVWKGERAQVEKAAATAGTMEQKIKALTALNADASATRVQQAYDRLVLEELGATETLRTLGITLGTQTTINYVERRRGTRPRIVPPGPAAPNTFVSAPIRKNIAEQEALRTMDSADTWRGSPASSIEFLVQNLPNTPGNQRFLLSLKQRFGTDAQRKEAEADAKRQGITTMTEQDTRAALNIIVDALTGHERIVGQSNKQAEELRKNINVTQNINEFLGNMGEIVADYQNNPVLAAAVVAGGFLAMRQAFRLFSGSGPRWMNWAMYAGLGGLAVGLYQERQTGSAWWNGLGDQINDWWRGDNALPPERRTMPNYWAREIQSDSETTRKCLSVLQDQDITTVCGFYTDMDSWERSSPRGPQPALPSTFNVTGLFGTMDNKAVGVEIHKVLKAFFQNRGNALVQQGFQYPGQESNAEARGFNYIRDRYNGRRFFSQIVQGTLRMEGAEVDGRLITTWETADTQARLREIYRAHPRAERPLVALHAAYVEEQRTANQARTPQQFRYVMLFEADPGALERMGRAGTQPASFLSVLQRHVTDALHQYSPFEPPAPDRSDRVTLLRPGTAEHELIALAPEDGGPGITDGGFGRLNAAPLILQDRVRTLMRREFREFLARVPVTAQARNLLITAMDNRIATPGVPLTDMMREVEDVKYRILITAANNSAVLNDLIVKNLATPAALSVPDFLRWLIPFEGERFPEINSLADVQSLFDINVRAPGGVPGFALWARMFPAWEGNQFESIRTQIEEIRGDLARLRQLPDFALPGAPAGAAGTQSMADLERFMAQKIVNRLVELSLYRLSADNTFIPSAREDRRVEGNERASLSEYIRDLRGNLINRDAMRNLEAFNKRVAEVQAVWPEARLEVLVVEGRVVIVMNSTGVSLRQSYLSHVNANLRFLARLSVAGALFIDPGERLALAPAQRLHPQEWTPTEFMDNTADDIVDEWSEAALESLRKSVAAAHTPGGPYPADFVMDFSGNDIHYKPNGNFAMASTPGHILLTKTAAEIRTRYQQFERPGGVIRPANSAPGNPF